MISRVLTCVGKVAEKPYYYEKLFVNIYSIEELCFVIHENAFMIERELISSSLAEWIDTECGLTDLSRELYQLINQNASVSAFAGRILDYTGYYSSEEVEKTEGILRDNVTMNAFERLKAKADFLAENGHLALAIREYDCILVEIPKEETDLICRILNNMGVAYVSLNLYEFAEECFYKAYGLTGDETALRHYLATKRLHISENEYINIAAQFEGKTDISIDVETQIFALRREFELSETAESLNEFFKLKSSAQAQEYYDKISNMTEELKDNYRDAVMDSGWRT